ncbi:MAG TPA: hypothetical protein PKO07_17610, partial [Pseudomonadota bacterium]|nr:hypothetical protein [Pseudomonadota bacterium]
MSAALPKAWLLTISAGYLLIGLLACVAAFRRGRLALLIPTLIAALLSGMLAAVGYGLFALHLWEPAFLSSGRELLGESLRSAVDGGLAIRIGPRVVVVEQPLWLLLVSAIPWLIP